MSLKVCIIGNDGAGKTTLAKFIQANVIPDIEVVSFASALKHDLSSLHLPVQDKPYASSLRGFIRAYGDLQRELHGPVYWVNRLFTSDIDLDKALVVDDMRYWSEFDAWSKRFSEDVRIITVGESQLVSATDAASVVEVNQLLRVLRKDINRHSLHLPNVKHLTHEDLLLQLTNYLK